MQSSPPFVHSLMLKAFTSMLLPHGFKDFYIGRHQPGNDVVLVAKSTLNASSCIILIPEADVRTTRSPFALVAAKLAHKGITGAEALA